MDSSKIILDELRLNAADTEEEPIDLTSRGGGSNHDIFSGENFPDQSSRVPMNGEPQISLPVVAREIRHLGEQQGIDAALTGDLHPDRLPSENQLPSEDFLPMPAEQSGRNSHFALINDQDKLHQQSSSFEDTQLQDQIEDIEDHRVQLQSESEWRQHQRVVEEQQLNENEMLREVQFIEQPLYGEFQQGYDDNQQYNRFEGSLDQQSFDQHSHHEQYEPQKQDDRSYDQQQASSGLDYDNEYEIQHYNHQHGYYYDQNDGLGYNHQDYDHQQSDYRQENPVWEADPTFYKESSYDDTHESQSCNSMMQYNYGVVQTDPSIFENGMSHDMSTERPLPIGWVKYYSDDGGWPYYFNAELQLSSWEHPDDANVDVVLSTNALSHGGDGNDNLINDDKPHETQLLSPLQLEIDSTPSDQEMHSSFGVQRKVQEFCDEMAWEQPQSALGTFTSDVEGTIDFFTPHTEHDENRSSARVTNDTNKSRQQSLAAFSPEVIVGNALYGSREFSPPQIKTGAAGSGCDDITAPYVDTTQNEGEKNRQIRSDGSTGEETTLIGEIIGNNVRIPIERMLQERNYAKLANQVYEWSAVNDQNSQYLQQLILKSICSTRVSDPVRASDIKMLVDALIAAGGHAGWFPADVLHMCVLSGNTTVLSILLDAWVIHSAAINLQARNENGETAVEVAARCGELQCLRMLVLAESGKGNQLINKQCHAAGGTENAMVGLQDGSASTVSNKNVQSVDKLQHAALVTEVDDRSKAITDPNDISSVLSTDLNILRSEDLQIATNSSSNRSQSQSRHSLSSIATVSSSESSNMEVPTGVSLNEVLQPVGLKTRTDASKTGDDSKRTSHDSLSLAGSSNELGTLQSHNENDSHNEIVLDIADVDHQNNLGACALYVSPISTPGQNNLAYSVSSAASPAVGMSSSPVNGTTAISIDGADFEELQPNRGPQSNRLDAHEIAWLQYECARDDGSLAASNLLLLDGGGRRFVESAVSQESERIWQNKFRRPHDHGDRDDASNIANGSDLVEAADTSSAVYVENFQSSASGAVYLGEWMECKTADGERYFYNSSTQQVQWERPVEENLITTSSKDVFSNKSNEQIDGRDKSHGEDVVASVAAKSSDSLRSIGRGDKKGMVTRTKVVKHQPSMGYISHSTSNTYSRQKQYGVEHGNSVDDVSYDPNNLSEPLSYLPVTHGYNLSHTSGDIYAKGNRSSATSVSAEAGLRAEASFVSSGESAHSITAEQPILANMGRSSHYAAGDRSMSSLSDNSDSEKDSFHFLGGNAPLPGHFGFQRGGHSSPYDSPHHSGTYNHGHENGNYPSGGNTSVPRVIRIAEAIHESESEQSSRLDLSQNRDGNLPADENFSGVQDAALSSIPTDNVDADVKSEINSRSEKHRHIEIWNRFFENAMMMSQQEKEQQSRATPNSGAAIAAAGRWPNSISNTKYKQLVAIAMKSSPGDKQTRPEQQSEDASSLSIQSITSLDGTFLSMALLAAALKDDVKTAEELLRRGSNPSCVDEQIRAPAHYASRAGNVSLLALLCDHGADLEATDAAGRTPLHTACIFRNIDALEFLLGCAVDCSSVDQAGNTPLHLAARAGFEAGVRSLISFGALATVRNSMGITPLDVAQVMRPQSTDLRATINILAKHSKMTFDQSHVSYGNEGGGSVRSQELHEGEAKNVVNSSAVEESVFRSAADAAMALNVDEAIDLHSSPANSVAFDADANSDSNSALFATLQRNSVPSHQTLKTIRGEDRRRREAAIKKLRDIEMEIREGRVIKNRLHKLGDDRSVSSANDCSDGLLEADVDRKEDLLTSSKNIENKYASVNELEAPHNQLDYTLDDDFDRSEVEEEDSYENGEADHSEGMADAVAASVWGVAVSLIDVTLNMFAVKGNSDRKLDTADRSRHSREIVAIDDEQLVGSNGSISDTGVHDFERIRSSTVNPAEGRVRSGLIDTIIDNASEKLSSNYRPEAEFSHAVERNAKNSWATSVAPPTDNELRERGLGIAVLSPPPLVAQELDQQYTYFKQQTHGNYPAAGAVPSSHMAQGSQQHQPEDLEYAGVVTQASSRNFTSTPPPSDVQVAIAISRATEKWKQTSGIVETGQSSAGSTSRSVYTDPRSATRDSSHEHNYQQPENMNSFSLGRSLPPGVSWRYVDVLHNNSSSNNSSNSSMR